MKHGPVVRRIDSADGKHYIEIVARQDGFFEFIETSELNDENGYPYWRPTHFSGIHRDLESVQREALAALPWIKHQISN